MDAFALLPDYCWRHVFRDLDAEDLLRCRDVCKYFHRLLEEQLFQQKWKFHLILPYLFSQFETNEMDSPVTWGNLLTNIRLVCKSWNKSLNKYVCEEEVEFEDYSKSSLIMDAYPLTNRFQTPEEIEEFQQAFGQVTTNPFPSRTVRIRTPEGLAGELRAIANREGITFGKAKGMWHARLCTKSMELMNQFGKDIFRFELYFSFEGPGPIDLCKLICEATRQLPNLKVFAVGYELDNNTNNNRYDLEIANDIQQNPLASLPKLKQLQIEEMLPQLQMYLLNKYSPQLIDFHMSALNSSVRQDCFQNFQNMKKLKLELQVCESSLESLRLLNSPLEELMLIIYDSDPRHLRIWEIDKTLFSIKHLPVNYLFLEAQNPMYIEESGKYSGNDYFNKSIETLEVNCYDGMTSLNFLQSFSKLKDLFVLSQGSEIMSEGGAVIINELLLDGENPGAQYKSNVWEKIPSFQAMTLWKNDIPGDYSSFLSSVFRREGYEAFKKNQIESKIEEVLEEGESPPTTVNEEGEEKKGVGCCPMT